MTREKTVEILRFCGNVDDAIRMNERMIRNFEEQYYTTVHSASVDGMPQGSGRTSSPVERVLLNIPRPVSETISGLKRENEKAAQVKKEILSELKRLNYEQKAVIIGFYIERHNWEWISARLHYSTRQCRNFRAAAIKKLGVYFSGNEAISNFFPDEG